MNLKIQKWIYVGLAVVIALLVVIIIRWRRSLSKYTYTDITAGTGPPETTTYSNIISCQVTYNTSNITATDATRPGFMTTFTNCVRSNVNIYVDNKCTYLTINPTSGTEKTAYDTYTSQINSIKTAYADITTKAAASLAGTPSTEIVEAALKADMTGATRKYLATVCPDYFKPGGVITNPTTVYTQWQIITGATAPAAGVYGFWAGATGVITAAAVNAWALKAARYTVDDTTNEFTVGAPYVATGSTYNSDTQITDPYATVTGTKYKNWEISRDNGPGTNNAQA